MHLHLRTEGDIPDNNKFSCAETFIHNCMHHANLIKILQNISNCFSAYHTSRDDYTDSSKQEIIRAL